MSACDPFREMYEAYALGALDAGEREAFEAHLRSGCTDCARAIDEARWLVSQLAYLAPEAEPPAMLKGRLMQQVRADAAQANRAQPKRAAVPVWMWAGVAALVVMSLYTTWEARRLERELQAARAEAAALKRIAEEQAAIDREQIIVFDPASVQIQMPPLAKGEPPMRAYWHAKLGILVAGLKTPAPPRGRALQLWLIPKAPGSKPLSAGLFTQRADGSLMVLVPNPQEGMAGTKLLAITEEPEGGSPQPTGEPRWTGTVGG